MTPLDLLRQLNELDEHARIEAKTASDLGRSLLETVCAYSNEPGLGGGWIVLGAKADESSFFRQYLAVGLNDPDKIQRDLVSACTTTFNRPIRVQIESGIVNGRNLLSVFVPEAAPGDKTIFFQSRPLPAGAFRRVGSADVHCTDDDLAIFYQERRGETFDATVLRDADTSVFDPAALAEYRRLRAEANASAEELKWTDDDLLYSLRCVTTENGVPRPTVAGVLLFGTQQALRHYFPLMRVDYIRVPGREWMQDPENRFQTVEMRASLISAIRNARAAILDDLPKAFSLPPGQIHRRHIPLVPDRVIHEAVVNAVMHRSYRVQGAIQIIRYSNRLEIRNPGHSLVADDRLGEPGSATRNPVLAAVLHDTNLAETKGSGVRVMRELMMGVGLTPPTFESDRQRDGFVVTCLFHHFLTQEDWDWLAHFTDAALSDEEARALVFARETGAINNLAYRTLNRVDVLNASQHLRRLRDPGLLQQKGKGAETYYLPTSKLMDCWGTPGEVAPGHSGQSGRSTAQILKAGEQSGSSASKSGRHPSRLRFLPGLPADLESDLAQLKAKVPQPEMEALAWRLCVWRSLSSRELAQALGRSRKYINDRLITPMLRAGRLERTIPDRPFDAQQTYRAVVTKAINVLEA